MGSDPLIRGCTVSGCGGRGIYVYQYSRPELTDTAVSRTGSDGIGVAHDSTATIRRVTVEDTRGHGIAHTPNFGNAREARRLVESIRKAQSQRLRSLGRMPTTEELRSLLADDVHSAAGKPGPLTKVP